MPTCAYSWGTNTQGITVGNYNRDNTTNKLKNHSRMFGRHVELDAAGYNDLQKIYNQVEPGKLPADIIIGTEIPDGYTINRKDKDGKWKYVDALQLNDNVLSADGFGGHNRGKSNWGNGNLGKIF